MPNNKLKDNEIIKALKCCMKIYKDCDNCPCINNNDYTNVYDCKYALFKNALDFINRLQAELKVSNEALNNSIKLNNCLENQNKELEETTHNLTIEKDALFDKAEELKAKVERLNALVKTKNKLIEGLDQSISYAYDRAIKEFAERLKKRIYKGGVHPTVEDEFMCDIDNLVKEFEKKENTTYDN